MTPLHKRVERVCTFTSSRGRRLVVVLAPGDVIEIRELRGKPLSVPVRAVWDMACRAEARAKQRERAERRKARRGGR